MIRPDEPAIHAFLAAALRGEPQAWPADWDNAAAVAAVGDAVVFHGIAGLLADRSPLPGDWPAALVGRLLDQARAEAMWELRHHDLLRRLLDALAEQGIAALAMKGSALAYTLYPRPAARPRGDTDLLVGQADVPAARRVLGELGFAPSAAGEGFEWLQEGWTLACADGGNHAIDLHWSALNAHALAQVLPAAECLAAARPLPGLGPRALQMDSPRTMLHLCVHRALHRTAPYLVAGEAFFGGDRLIWSVDIHLLAGRFDAGEWAAFTALAVDRRVAGACLDGLAAAQADLGTAIPAPTLAALRQAAPRDLAYLQDGRALGREWHNLRAMPGWGQKLRYLRSRLVPRGDFIRNKYPGMARAPLSLILLRRLADAVRHRGAPGGR